MCVVIGTLILKDEFRVHLIKKINKDMDEFMDATNEEDELQIILRGHIYIEHEIEKMLINHLVEPSVIMGGRNRLNFNTKLNLAVALGLLPKDKKSPYDKLGGLRNKYAHKLNYKMTELDLNKLVDSMDKEIRSNVFEREWNVEREMTDEKRQLLKLKRSMLSLWVYVSKLVHTLSLNEFEKRIGELEARYIESDDKAKVKIEAERKELFNKLRNEVGITEESCLNF
ncbi:hypothetical protein [Bacillus cereus]|uniref:hypothetical protein n=1 Tax=Bacillus cereus TaxID=1396 RepID=UPI0020D239F5|nr:hypothetical protein [Bacillus cereus]